MESEYDTTNGQKCTAANERFASHFVQSISGATAAGRADLLVLCTRVLRKVQASTRER